MYLAEDTQLHRSVALKVLPPEVAANQDRMRRFLQEAQAAAALNHPAQYLEDQRFQVEQMTLAAGTNLGR